MLHCPHPVKATSVSSTPRRGRLKDLLTDLPGQGLVTSVVSACLTFSDTLLHARQRHWADLLIGEKPLMCNSVEIEHRRRIKT